MQFLRHSVDMKLDVRRTIPLTADDYEQVLAYLAEGTPEHEALARLTPVPLREGSEGSALRALMLLGMTYVRERQEEAEMLAEGYDELAAERLARPTDVRGRRANMARRARSSAYR